MATARFTKWKANAFAARRWSLRIGLLLLLAWIAGCTSSANPTQSAPAGASGGGSNQTGGKGGRIGLALDIAGGAGVDLVKYAILASTGNVVTSGRIDVANSKTASTVVAGVPTGTADTLQLSAASDDGGVTCSGTSAPFDVSAGATSSVYVLLECQLAATSGTVAINGGVNVCPKLTSATINPSEITVGGTMALSAAADDSDDGPSPLSYAWTASGPGTIANGSSPDATFQCTGAGAATLTLTVSDGDQGCNATSSYPVTCDPVGGVTLNPNAQLADPDTLGALTSYDPSSGLLVFSSATPMLTGLSAGDVILSGGAVGAAAPNGFMRKVTSVTTSGSQVTVATTQATLVDAVASAYIDAHQAYTDPSAVQFVPALPGVTLEGAAPRVPPVLGPQSVRLRKPKPETPIGPAPTTGMNINLDGVQLKLQAKDSNGNATASVAVQAALSGWININPDVFVHLDMEGCGFLCVYAREFDIGAELDQSADVQAVITGTVQADYHQPVGTITFPTFCTYVLCWTPSLEIDIGVSVSGQVSITLHAADQVSLEAGTQWNDDHNGHSGWTDLSHAAATGNFDVPTVQATVTASAYVQGKFAILLYDTVGANATTKAALAFDIATPRRPFLKFDAQITQGFGVEATAFGFFTLDYTANLPTLDLPLGQSANIPPLILSVSPGSGTTSRIDLLELQVVAYDLQDGTNLTYSWTDGNGTVLGTRSTLTSPSVSPGVHDFTVAVTDTVGAATTQTIQNVTVTLPPPPALTIASPANGAQETAGLGFALSATVVDANGVPHCTDPAWSFAWTDQTTGASLATACTGTAMLTAPGEHTLAFTATGPFGPTTQTFDVQVAAVAGLQASITQGINGYFAAAGANCLPITPVALVGEAAGGVPPYTYSWSVAPQPSSGPAPAPIFFAKTASTTTASFPSAWSEDLSAEAQNAGEKVTITFSVTDSLGTTAPATTNNVEHMTWACVPE